jgi:hypothetical protein
MGAFAWPAAVVVIGVVFLLLYHKPLSGLIDRTQELSKSGLRTTASSSQASAGASSATTPALEASKAEELLKSFDNALLLERESRIHTELEKQQIAMPAERERILVRFLAGATIALEFERIYADIWGSQIASLQFLNSASPGVASTRLQPAYDRAAKQWPAFYKNYSFENWLGFLERNGLVEITGSTIAIRLLGREFLKHLVHQGRLLFKDG